MGGEADIRRTAAQFFSSSNLASLNSSHFEEILMRQRRTVMQFFSWLQLLKPSQIQRNLMVSSHPKTAFRAVFRTKK